jgi:hypothetical protein
MHTINVEEVTQYGVETIPKLDAFSRRVRVQRVALFTSHSILY